MPSIQKFAAAMKRVGAVILLLGFEATAQDSTVVLTKADSAAVYAEVMAELAALGFAQEALSSFFDVNIGFGNGSFSQKAYLQQAEPLPTGYFSVNAAYLHRTGLSLSGGVNVIGQSKGLTAFQGSIGGAYDYRSSKWSAGVSFTRYFNKDSLNFYVSPLVNGVYTYAVLRRGWLQPKLAVDAGWGQYDERENLRYIDTLAFPRLKPLVRSLSGTLGVRNVFDISFLLSAKHQFVWKMGHTPQNQFSLTPSLSAIFGTARYGSNLGLSNAGGFRSGTTAQLQAQRYQARYRQWFPEPDERFLWQSTNLSFVALASWALVSLQAQCTLSYAIPEAVRGVNAFYNISVGFSF
jgi:hypothetical protein